MGSEPWFDQLLDPDLQFVWGHAVHSQSPSTFGFADRTIDDHVLWFLTAGGITVACDDHSFRLGPDDLIWIRPGTTHSANSHGHHRALVCYSLRFRLPTVTAPSGILMTPKRPDLLSIVDGILHDTQGDDAIATRRIGAGLYLLASADRKTDRATGFTHNQRQRMLTFARRQASRRPTPAELATIAGLSPDYFSRLFKRSFGRSPQRWLLEQRIHQAAFRIAHESTPISDIAQALGYSDEALFRRQFRTIMGCSPTQHRHKH